jgi:hypothetical protein
VGARPFSRGHISEKNSTGHRRDPIFGVPARHREPELTKARQAGAPLSFWESATHSLNLKYWVTFH